MKFLNKLLNRNHYTGVLHPGNTEVLNSLRKGDLAIDCGANVGDVSALLAASGAEVHAFEPNPYAFQALKDRFQDMPNVKCINKGVNDKAGKLPLYLHVNSSEDEVKWSTGSSLLKFKGNVDGNKYVEVDLIDLDEYICMLGRRVKILKMDIEGAEYDILEKMINSGSIKKVGAALVETHDEKIPELKEKAERVKKLIRNKKIKNINLNWI